MFNAVRWNFQTFEVIVAHQTMLFEKADGKLTLLPLIYDFLRNIGEFIEFDLLKMHFGFLPFFLPFLLLLFLFRIRFMVRLMNLFDFVDWHLLLVFLLRI
jgi:hypothetical protein